MATDNKRPSPLHDADWFIEVLVDPLVLAELDLHCDGAAVVQVSSAWADPGTNRWAIGSASWNGIESVGEARDAAVKAISDLNQRLGADSPLHPLIQDRGRIWHRDACPKLTRQHQNVESAIPGPSTRWE
jgi:hypothetical protein